MTHGANRIGTVTPGFEERVNLALASLARTYEQRGDFISDSDVLDAADSFTTDPPWADDEDDSTRPRSDYELLTDVLDERADEYIAHAVLASRPGGGSCNCGDGSAA